MVARVNNNGAFKPTRNVDLGNSFLTAIGRKETLRAAKFLSTALEALEVKHETVSSTLVGEILSQSALIEGLSSFFCLNTTIVVRDLKILKVLLKQNEEYFTREREQLAKKRASEKEPTARRRSDFDLDPDNLVKKMTSFLVDELF